MNKIQLLFSATVVALSVGQYVLAEESAESAIAPLRPEIAVKAPSQESAEPAIAPIEPAIAPIEAATVPLRPAIAVKAPAAQTTESPPPAPPEKTTEQPPASPSPTSEAPSANPLEEMGLGMGSINGPTAPLLMETIKQAVIINIDKQTVVQGPYFGMVLHVHNGTNAPVLLDGDRAQYKVGTKVQAVVSDRELETATITRNGAGRRRADRILANVVTINSASWIGDETIEHGPVLSRYGADEKRREATASRFGLRAVWPGDDTSGTVYFRGQGKSNGGELALPVVTFPEGEVRGYLSVQY